MKCERCEEKMDESSCESRELTSGTSYNSEFGQEDHWFQGEFKCPKCGEWNWHGDSSL